MPDEKLSWWRDGDQVRAILSDIGKWLIVIVSAWLAHDAKVDSNVAKEKATQNAAHIDELKATRFYGEKK